jgi:hypothetical protein
MTTSERDQIDEPLDPVNAPVRIDNPVLADTALAAVTKLGRQTVKNIVEIGRRLSECRALLKEDQHWRVWLQNQLKLSPQTAGRFIQVYELSGNVPNVERFDLPVSALYLLAAPSTPDEARDEIINSANAGEAITVKTVKNTITKARTNTKGRQQPAKKRPRRPAEPKKPIAAAEASSAAQTTKAETDIAAREPRAQLEQDVGRDSNSEASRLRARVEELENERHRLKSENPGLQSQYDDLWQELKAHVGADADAAPLWCRLQHLLNAALAACERDGNWPRLNPDQQERRNRAIEALRAAMADLLEIAAPAGAMPPILPSS